MLYFNLKNYEDFKEIFAWREVGENRKARRNKVLLKTLLNRDFAKLMKKYSSDKRIPDSLNPIFSRNMQDLKQRCMFVLECNTGFLMGYRNSLGNGVELPSDTYVVNSNGGVSLKAENEGCIICDIPETGQKNQPIKAGKFFEEALKSCEFGRILPKETARWLAEVFVEDWKAYVNRKRGGVSLYVDDNFKGIYNSAMLKGDFGSCMNNRGFWTFYRDCVNAKAAYLMDGNSMIVARCIIYMDCEDEETGEVLRLAERQYSSNGDNTLKRNLIERLIEGKYIDGYKTVGADCHSPKSFVRNDGTPLSHVNFRIKCNLDRSHVFSYQDSFKFYSRRRLYAYNHEFDGYISLSNTGGYIDDGTVESRAHGCFISRDEACYVSSYNDYFYMEECIEDFTGCWILKTDAVTCDEDGCEHVVCKRNAVYSPITEKYYCSTACKAKAEIKYKKLNWFYSEYDDTYHEDEDEIVRVMACDRSVNAEEGEFVEITISKRTYDRKVGLEKIVSYNGKDYLCDVLREATKLARIIVEKNKELQREFLELMLKSSN